MRIHFVLTAAFVAAPFVARAAEPFLNYPEAVASAKAKGADTLLLVDWPDRAPDSAAVRRAFASSEVRTPFGERAVWGVFEYTESAAKEEKKPAKGTTPEFTPWNLPAVGVLDPDGHVFAVAEGLRANTVRSVLSQIPALLDTRRKRDELWAKARATAGVERANLFGAGLDLMAQPQAEARKDIVEEIRKADPKDASGYHFKYTFDASSFHERTVDALIKEKKSAEVLALVDEKMRNPRITTRQRQVLLTARFQALKADRLPAALETLRSITKLDPRNDMGRGAEQFLKYYTEPVRLAGREWTGGDNRPIWLPMIADVSDAVKTPGTYEIEFKHKSGGTRFSKTELVAGGKVIADDPNKKESRKLRLVVTEAPKAPVELRADSQGTGWFDGAGEIVVTKVN
jgi:hypothetical protein